MSEQAKAADAGLRCELCGSERSALIESDQRLAFALEAGGLGSWELDLTTRQLIHSDICRANFGLLPTDTLDTYDDLVRRVHPDDREIQRVAIEQSIKTRSALNFEYRAMHPDGRISWIEVRGHAIYAPDGTPARMTGVSIDVTFRKRAEERQKVLLDELNHRVKNTLATVQSIAMQTQRNATSSAAYSEDLSARIAALARAHDLLTEESWDGASLSDVIDQTLARYKNETACRVVTGGPPVRLRPNAAVTLNMAFHELATNAARYGALSTKTGRVSVKWDVRHIRDQNCIEIIWHEANGPTVGPPRRRGFGSRLLERGVTAELGGEVALYFTADGVRCHMYLPLSAKIVLEG